MEHNQTAQRQLPDGTQLRNGDYRTIRMIGHGGFGITYLAQHRIFGEVALKELFLNSGATYCSRESTTQQQVIPHFDPTQFVLFKKRFEEEARTLFNLQDVKGVVKVLDIFEENDTIYFSMEYLKGEKLDEYVKRRGRLTEEDGLGILKTLGRTLHAIHKRNVLHRDIKPTNVIIGAEGRVTLIDFGIARSYIDEIAETHTTFHSPRYSPPEQKIANAKLGAYSDVYALGATAYFMFTGMPPQSIEERSTEDFIPARQITPTLPVYIDEALTRSLSLKKEARFQTVKEFLAALHLDAEPTQSAPASTTTVLYPSPSTDENATVILPPEKLRPNLADNTVIQAPSPDESTKIQVVPPAKELPKDDGATIIEPLVKKPAKRKNHLVWMVPLLIILAAAAVYLLMTLREPPVEPAVDPTVVPDTTVVPQPTVQPTVAPEPLIKPPSAEDDKLHEANKTRIERLLVGSWASPGNRNMRLESTRTAKFGTEQDSLTWNIQPMKGGIYLRLESLDDSKNWRFIVSEEKAGTQSTLVLKLHDAPGIPFTAAENMAVYTRKR